MTDKEEMGKLGEEIVYPLLQKNFPNVHDQRGRCLWDFCYYDDEGNCHYADAKARKINPHDNGFYYSFSFERDRLGEYVKLSDEKGFPFELWVVDAYGGKVYVEEVHNLLKPCTIGERDSPATSIRKRDGEIRMHFHPKQFGRTFTIDADNPALLELRERYGIKETADGVRQSVLEKPAAMLVSPGGVNIDICAVEGTTRQFVKAARIYSAFTGLDAGMSYTHPLIRAAKAFCVTVHRFYPTRLSGKHHHGKKGFFLAVEDVPTVLRQYLEFYHRSKGEKQLRYNAAAKELAEWFEKSVVPKFSRRNVAEK